MHLILTGATGLVGSAVLDAMIKMKDVSRISVISRRPVKMAEDAGDPRVRVIIHKDFARYDEDLLDQVRGANGCVWALGISQTQVGKEEYVKITKDFALAAAEAFQRLPAGGEPFDFVYVSGEGATQQPGRLTPLFGRVKGETEVALAEMRKANPLFRASAVRPAFVDAAAHDAVRPYLPAQPASTRVANLVLGPAIRVAARGSWSPTEPLGRFLAEMATGRWEGRLQGPGVERLGESPVLGNAAFRRLYGLDGR